MDNIRKEIISQQINATIKALQQASNTLASDEIDQHLGTAAAFIHDIQFNVMLLKPTENNNPGM